MAIDFAAFTGVCREKVQVKGSCRPTCKFEYFLSRAKCGKINSLKILGVLQRLDSSRLIVDLISHRFTRQSPQICLFCFFHIDEKMFSHKHKFRDPQTKL